MNRKDSNSLSGHSDYNLSMVDNQMQTQKTEYTRSQLIEFGQMSRDQTVDMVEKAKNMKICDRIIRKNANNMVEKLVDPKVVPAPKDKKMEANFDDFWSMATTDNRNVGQKHQMLDDFSFDFEMGNRWPKSHSNYPSDSSLNTNAKVDSWLKTGQDHATQYSQNVDIFNEPSTQSKTPTNEYKRTETASLVSDVSTTSDIRSKLLDKTAKLKQTLSNLKQQNN